MLEYLKTRRRALLAGTAAEAGEGGFTLIELMVVVLIIAILIAIAIPQFLGSKNTSEDRAAQSDLTVAVTDASAIFSNSQDYSVATLNLASMTSTENNLVFTTTAANAKAATNNVYVAWSTAANANSASAIQFSILSTSGKCWMEWQGANAATEFGEDTGGCAAADTPANAPANGAPPSSSGTIYWQTNSFPIH